MIRQSPGQPPEKTGLKKIKSRDIIKFVYTIFGEKHMSTDNKNILQARLKNCLLTIVELEPLLSRLTVHRELLEEFKQLKDIAAKISNLELSDSEVERIEQATEVFLSELEIPRSYFYEHDLKSMQ